MSNTKQKVDTLWREMREAINKTYAAAKYEDEEQCLRDYAQDISMRDALDGLLGRETANERQHRSNRPSVPGFGFETAAKLILMSNVCEGASKTEMPSATLFLVYRQTAAEAWVIGFLIRKQLTKEWRDAVQSLDYAKLMQAAYPQEKTA